MDKSKAPPLQSLSLTSRPLVSHAIAWSSDAELAVATLDGIHVFLPEYPRSTSTGASGDGEKPPSDRYATSPQFPLFLHTSGALRPDPLINAQLCLFAGVHELPPPPPPPGGADGATGFPGVGRGKVTGAGASLGQIIRVEWSPSGLGCNLRPVLAALTGHGAIICFGEHIDLRKGGGSSTTAQSRSFKNWRTLWGLGAQLPLPIPGEERAALGTDVEVMDERITSFSWAREISPGRALLAYANDEKEVAIMAVQFYGRGSAPDEKGWEIQEVGRFDAAGPHTMVDRLDPDFISSGSAFALKWSPWSTHDGKQTATISYIANNHVGFRRITIREIWRQGETPSIKVEEHDTKGICISLSTDAFLEWENIPWNDDGVLNMRGIIASPFLVHPFQIPLTGPLSDPIPRHALSVCSTTYPKEESTHTNPITGLVIHHAESSHRPPAPQYSLIRQSCTATNQDWFQTTLREDETPIPQWAEDIGQRTVRRIPLSRALSGKNIDDSDDSDDDDPMDQEDEKLEGDSIAAGAMADGEVQMREQPDTGERQVHPRRFRLWGLAASPGDGCTAVVVSKYNTQHPHRRDYAEIMFGWYVANDGEEDQAAISRNTLPPRASTEARVWEWMYGRGDEVPGTTNATDIIPLASSLSTLRRQFRDVLPKMRCVFCDTRVQEKGSEAECENGHSFATCASSGVPIMAPGISRVCAVCGLRCLKSSELSKAAQEHLGRDVPLDAAAEVCGGCGGKFIV